VDAAASLTAGNSGQLARCLATSSATQPQPDALQTRIMSIPRAIIQKVVLATSTHHPLSMAARRVTKTLLDLKREMPADQRLPSASPRLVSRP